MVIHPGLFGTALVMTGACVMVQPHLVVDQGAGGGRNPVIAAADGRDHEEVGSQAPTLGDLSAFPTGHRERQT
jgi:hypothetical protein